MGKKKIFIIIIVLLLLLLFGFILFLILRDSSKITLETGGISIISEVKVSNSEIIELPVAADREGYTFVGWKNEDNKIVRKGTKVNKNTILTAVWIKNDVEFITIEFNANSSDSINNIITEKGGNIILPDDPIKEGYIFAGWVDSEGNAVNETTVLDADTELTALWIAEGTETISIEVKAEDGSIIYKLLLEKGKNVILPVTPSKEGYVFLGWYDENDNMINKDTIAVDNIKITAKWVKYTCPDECTPNADGKTCTKTETTSITKTVGCPSGYTMIDNQCLNLKTKYYAISIDSAPWWKCNSSDEGSYDEVFGGGAIRYCAKKTNKITTEVCPSGYTKDGNICKKTQTLSCTAG